MTNISWPGNNQRFYHRKGGSDGGNGRWRDSFGANNQNDYVCSTSIPVEAGNHVLSWSIQMLFANPVCILPKAKYPAYLASVIGPKVKSAFAVISQVSVCANRDNLVWTGDLLLNFYVPELSDVSVGISAFDDRNTYESTNTGAKEAIVLQMKIYPNMVNARDDNIVWPFEGNADSTSAGDSP